MARLRTLASPANRRRVAWALTVVLLVAVAALGVFRVAWGHELDPGDYIVGAGTLALAVATLALARYTARQAELTKKSIEAAEKPHVIATPHPEHLDGIQFEMDATLHLFFRVWNIGRGPGVVFKVTLQEGLQESSGRRTDLIDPPRPLAVGGVADLDAAIPTHTVPLPDTFTLRIYCADGSNKIYETTQEVWREDNSMVLVPLTYIVRELKRGEFGKLIEASKARQ